MKSSRVKVGLTSAGDTVLINDKGYILWQGYVTVDNRPLMAISGLESEHPEYGRSIMINEDGDRENRLGSIRLKDPVYKTKEDGTKSESNPVESRNFELMGLKMYLSGWMNINEETGVRRFVLKHDAKQEAYITDPALGGANYLKYGKEIPVFVNDNGMTDEQVALMLNGVAEFYPGFETWWSTTFPSSSANASFTAAAQRRKEILSGFNKKELKAIEENIPWD